jgi:paraquat-inducible protein B
MSDTPPPTPPAPEAKVVPARRWRPSAIWLIPFVAAAAGAWIAIADIRAKGPEISIEFSSAEGLSANNTIVYYNGLAVGTLSSLRLADDHQHVIATAKMHATVKNLLVKDTEFWVVKPRISGLNISGLGTLVSGDYIGMQLGHSTESERFFVARESPPLTGNTPGREFVLKTKSLGSLGPGTPVLFRQLPAGQVVACDLDDSGNSLSVRIFVPEQYERYVTANTRFWQASGVDVSLSAEGLHVQTESLMTILAGGISFETPAGGTLPPAPADTVFTLFDNRTDAESPPPQDPRSYLLVFQQSVRGLKVGAPVELGGVTIGEVTEIAPQIDIRTSQFTVPVTISLDPQRYGVKFLGLPSGKTPEPVRETVMNALVKNGLRGELKTGNLLTGSMYVALDCLANQPEVALDWSQNPVILPTQPGEFDALEDSVAGLVVGLRGTLTNVDNVLLSANQVISTNSVFLKHLDQTVVKAGVTLTNANILLGNANQFIEPDSALNTELNTLLLQGGGAARSLRALADYLEEHPEALIRGKIGTPKP